MRYNELELSKRIKNGTENISIEEEISLNILNFLRSIYLNNQDFYRESYNTQYFGELEMTFSKSSNSLVGHCKAFVKSKNRVYDYLFTENGYELLDDVVKEKQD